MSAYNRFYCIDVGFQAGAKNNHSYPFRSRRTARMERNGVKL